MVYAKSKVLYPLAFQKQFKRFGSLISTFGFFSSLAFGLALASASEQLKAELHLGLQP